MCEEWNEIKKWRSSDQPEIIQIYKKTASGKLTNILHLNY